MRLKGAFHGRHLSPQSSPFRDGNFHFISSDPFETLQVQVKRLCVHGQVGETKTPASARPVPLHPAVASELPEWKKVTVYRAPSDFLFPSIRNNGQVPVWPDILLKKVIRPAVERAGITGKNVGWHTFRHSLGTNLRFLGIDIKTAQELLRHANSRITLALYTQAVSSKTERQMHAH
ncbi:MAG TPA: site-specific integrase [Terracidiphilus sp.]|jgi:integrase|nr:site-specific integrase [Terracidiphilus sp.]